MLVTAVFKKSIKASWSIPVVFILEAGEVISKAVVVANGGILPVFALNVMSSVEA
jgi:hypothetical protein